MVDNKRRAQLVKLFRHRLGDELTKLQIDSAIDEALGGMSVHDFDSETLGLQVSLLWDEREALRITHIAAIDRDKEWVSLTNWLRRKKQDMMRKREARARERANKERAESPRLAAVRAALNRRMTMAELCGVLHTHPAFLTSDGELLTSNTLRKAISRALDDLGEDIESETRPAERGLLERIVSPRCGPKSVTVTVRH